MNKVKRKIIKIDETLCNGCENCIPACPEQAIQMVDTPNGKKARLVKELYCDGLGACLGDCPTGALTIEEREAEVYDEEATIARIKELAPEMLETHLKHLKEHSEKLPEHHSHKIAFGGGCPSSQMMQWEKQEQGKISEQTTKLNSELKQWPVQLHLVSPFAPYFKNANLVLVADCVPFAYPNFHQDFLRGNSIAIACPKLDDTTGYIEKIAQIIQIGNPKSIKIVHMEVPCCFGLVHIVKEAMKQSGKNVPLETVVIGIKGEKK